MLARTLHAGLALEPLSGALAAGNAVVVKPSELAPCTSAFLAANIPKYLDPKAVKVVEGGADVGDRLMEHRWDKVLFTGNTIRPRTSSLNRDDELATDSPCIRCLNVSSDDGRFRVSLAGSSRVGRLIMTKAAKHLTPVALELGSKCPCIVDRLDSSRDSQVRPPLCCSCSSAVFHGRMTTTLIILHAGSCEPHNWGQMVHLFRPSLHRHRLRAGRGGICAHSGLYASVFSDGHSISVQSVYHPIGIHVF